MPQENRKRGRRAESQRQKLEESEEHDQKRRKTSNGNVQAQEEIPREHDQVPDGCPFALRKELTSSPFYGLLDEEEQEYFRRADDMLEVNQFVDPEEKALFLANVYKEAEGKELKLAHSQSCSRLLERLILHSTPDQLKHLLGKFSGHFLNLVQHRFASHCCETLFAQAAPVVTQELVAVPQQHSGDIQSGKVLVTMENLFLFAINELEGSIGFLMTDRFASHTLRVLLMILSGQPLDDASLQPSLLRSKRKEHISVVGSEKSRGKSPRRRVVPHSFMQALEKMIHDSVLGLDTTYLRALATHQTGNPMLQLLVQLDLTYFAKERAKDEKSLIRKLLPDDPLTEDTESASFINGLLYDPVGSRLLETIVEHSPGKMFKVLHKEFFKDRMGSLARNEIAGYVVAKILERLSSEDLQTALNAILPQIPSLVERNRTSIIKTLIERCDVRGLVTQTLATALQHAYSTDGTDNFSILRMLQVSETVLPTANGSSSKTLGQGAQSPRPPDYPGAPNPSQLHASLLAQIMLRSPGPLSSIIFGSLATLSSSNCLILAKTPSTSHVLQAALTSPHATPIFRRKLITRYYGHIASLSMHPSASHVVDAISDSTQKGMAFIRERVAEELAENEVSLRESVTGRKVWKNWRMDLYRRRRAEWVRQCRRDAGNDRFQSFPGGTESLEAEEKKDVKARPIVTAKKRRKVSNEKPVAPTKVEVAQKENGRTGKTNLNLAREKYAARTRKGNSFLRG